MKRPRQSAVRQNAGPLALFSFVVNVTASFFRQFSRHISTWEKELNRRRQTLKPLENQGFFRLSLLYRNGTPTRHFSSTWEKAHCSSRNGSGMRRYRPRLGHMGTCIPIPTKQSQRSSPASSTTVSRRRASRTTRATNTRRTTTVHEKEKTGALPPRSSTRPRPTSRFLFYIKTMHCAISVQS